MSALADKAQEPVFYTYEHWQPGNSTPFYVGKGKRRRAYEFKRSKNTKYRGVVKNLESLGLEVEVRILSSGLVEAEAFQLEFERIRYWRQLGADLCNRTDGGEGESWTMEARERLRQVILGRGRSQKQREALLKVQQSNVGKKRSAETREAMRVANKRRVLPPEVWDRIKAGLSRAHKGKVMSTESRQKMSASQRGRTHSEETKQKMRVSALAREARKRQEAA